MTDQFLLKKIECQGYGRIAHDAGARHFFGTFDPFRTSVRRNGSRHKCSAGKNRLSKIIDLMNNMKMPTLFFVTV